MCIGHYSVVKTAEQTVGWTQLTMSALSWSSTEIYIHNERICCVDKIIKRFILNVFRISIPFFYFECFFLS